MIDHFGPTETAIAATSQVWLPGDEVQDHIGRPLDGSHVSIPVSLQSWSYSLTRIDCGQCI